MVMVMGGEEFGMDCHDLSLENIFVDEDDHSKIVRLANSLNLITAILTLFLDVHHRLGVDDNPTTLGGCPPSLIPPI